jgi:hypothetical protein
MRLGNTVRAAATGVFVMTLVAPAAAQFDPNFNNLKCYKIGGPSFVRKVQLDNQFGREIVAKLVPQFLCVPTHKTCCDPSPAIKGCQPVACPSDPTGNQPAPVDHFKCYKIGVKQCDQASAVACDTVTGKFVKTPVDLFDQFHEELNVIVGVPKMLCVPVRKVPKNTTTTQPPPSTTTTTIQGCQPDTGHPPTCAGSCPNSGEVCVNKTPGVVDCGCVPDTQVCAAQNPAVGCTPGKCPRQDQQCAAGPVPPGGCACTPP